MPKSSYKDRNALRMVLESSGSINAAARDLGVHRSTVKWWMKRHGLESPWSGKAITATAPEELELDVDHIDDLESLLAERGMRLEDWVVVRVTVNKWEANAGGGVKMPLRQLKVFLRPVIDVSKLIQPGSILPPTSKSDRQASRGLRSKLFFIYGDDQRPHQDETFERLKLDWVTDNGPDEIIDLGDGMDFSTVSMHKVNPAMNWSVQECADSYATWLWRLRDAAPWAKISILADNHVTGRLRDYQLANALALYGVRPAEVPGLVTDLEPLWSIRRLLRLDELGINYLEPPNDTNYAESQVELVPGELVAIHGYRTGRNLGQKFVDDYGTSVIYGHQHGQDVYVTDQRRRGVGQRHRVFALGVGCGMKLHGGGGFAPGADWQNCALTVSVFPDGEWSWSYMDYADGALVWQDQRYS